MRNEQKHHQAHAPRPSRSDIHVGVTATRGGPKVAGLEGHHVLNSYNSQDSLFTRWVGEAGAACSKRRQAGRRGMRCARRASAATATTQRAPFVPPVCSFRIGATWYFDLSVDGFTTHAVFSNGSGVNLGLDGHRSGAAHECGSTCGRCSALTRPPCLLLLLPQATWQTSSPTWT